MNKRIAVVGTGIMGSGIAANFLKAGYDVTVWNRTPAHAEPLIKQGAAAEASPRAAAAAADIIFEVTANDESSRAAWQGDNGILDGVDVSKTLIASATLTVDWIEELARLCAGKGYNFFDMPLTGGRPAAESGTLTLLTGGDEQKLALLKPDLTAISSKILYFGPSGSGMKYKLTLNALQATHLAAFGEAMRLAEKAGLDAAAVGPALVDRPGGIQTVIGWQAYQAGDIPLSFSVDWIAKDLHYAKQMAGDLPLPLLDDVLAGYDRLQKHGHGNDDWAMIIKKLL